MMSRNFWRRAQNDHSRDDHPRCPGEPETLLRVHPAAFVHDELAHEAGPAREKLTRLLDCARKALPDDSQERKEHEKKILHFFIPFQMDEVCDGKA